jgi:hypothetical protein
MCRLVLVKISNMKFLENLSSASHADTYRRTYTYDEANGGFCGFANVPKYYTPCKLIF